MFAFLLFMFALPFFLVLGIFAAWAGILAAVKAYRLLIWIVCAPIGAVLGVLAYLGGARPQ